SGSGRTSPAGTRRVARSPTASATYRGSRVSGSFATRTSRASPFPAGVTRPHPATDAATSSASHPARRGLDKACPVFFTVFFTLAVMLFAMRRKVSSLASFAVAAVVVLSAPDVAPGPLSSSVPSSVPSSTAPSADLVPELDAAARAIASDRALSGASVGIAILDVDSGRMLAAVNEHLALNPASNAKLYTAGAALATLHGERRYETTLSGRLDGEAVGGLALRGYGDPSLATEDLWALVQELRAYGVTRVDGDIAVDQAFYDDQTTPVAFEQQPNEWASFRAPIGAVALDENCVTLTVRPAGGGTARVEFDPPGFVDVDGTIRTAASGGADTVELALSANGARLAAHVSGAISADSRLVRYTRRVEDPRLLAGYALQALLDKAG